MMLLEKCQLKVHLYSHMAEPFPILADKAYVAIPHTYIPVSTLLSYNSYVTLGQEWDEKGVIYPPHYTCPWGITGELMHPCIT